MKNGAMQTWRHSFIFSPRDINNAYNEEMERRINQMGDINRVFIRREPAMEITLVYHNDLNELVHRRVQPSNPLTNGIIIKPEVARLAFLLYNDEHWRVIAD